MYVRFRCHADFVVRPKCHPDFIELPAPRRSSAMLALVFAALSAQSDDDDPEMRIQQLENQLRQLTGQNEELQYRNRQLEDRLRVASGRRARRARRSARGRPAQHRRGTSDPAQSSLTGNHRSSRDMSQQIAAPAPIVQEPEGVPPAPGRRRGDAFDPSQNPNAPGAPRALGGGQLPIPAEAPVGAPGGRDAGEPLDLGNTGGASYPAEPPPAPGANGGADHSAAVGDAEGRVRSRHRLHGAQGLCAGGRDHAQFRAKISRAIP